VPLVLHALRVFDQVPSVREILIAVAPGTKNRFRRDVLSRARLRVPVILVDGGKTRAQSVWNALKRVAKKNEFVCIHDAARPMLQPAWVNDLIREMNGWDGVVLGRKVIPTIKTVHPKQSEIEKTLDRSQLFEAQTPQLIRIEALRKSYRLLGERAFEATDDASLIEATGGRVKAFAHLGPNMKVTTPDDLTLVRRLMQKGSPFHFGLGFDRHRLVPKRPFYLGGIKIRSRVGPLGHSDGDALLHAITDGILGALGLGDIGDHFPDTNRRWKKARSDQFVARALELAREKGSVPAQVDATLVLERPKLGTHKKKIQSRVAKLLSLPVSQISIKAKTAEGRGGVGAG